MLVTSLISDPLPFPPPSRQNWIFAREAPSADPPLELSESGLRCVYWNWSVIQWTTKAVRPIAEIGNCGRPVEVLGGGAAGVRLLRLSLKVIPTMPTGAVDNFKLTIHWPVAALRTLEGWEVNVDQEMFWNVKIKI